MANSNLQANTDQANEPPLSVRELHAAYRRAKAQWELTSYAPEYVGKDLPDEINNALSDQHTAALERFMLAPGETAVDLAQKLRTFRDEQLWDWQAVAQFVDRLTTDAAALIQVKAR